MRPVEALNIKFLNKATPRGGDRKTILENEIDNLTTQLFQKREEYMQLVNGKESDITEYTLQTIRNKFPFLLSEWISSEPNGGFSINAMAIPMEITVGGEESYYTTLPFYNYRIIVPLGEGQINIVNESSYCSSELTYPFIIRAKSYGHPHANTNNRSFTYICTGNNPFLNMYYEGRIQTPKDISEFLIHAVKWTSTVNTTDMYSAASSFHLLQSARGIIFSHSADEAIKAFQIYRDEGLPVYSEDVAEELSTVNCDIVKTIVEKIVYFFGNSTQHIDALMHQMLHAFLFIGKEAPTSSLKNPTVMNYPMWDLQIMYDGQYSYLNNQTITLELEKKIQQMKKWRDFNNV